MTKLTELTIAQALKGYKAKEFSVQEVVKDHIEAATKGQKETNAFIVTTFDQAAEEAKASDVRYAAGQAGPLEGVPIAMKDLYCTKGVQTTAASKILEGFIPTYESTVSQKLKDAGTISLGKANLDEFAMGSSNTTSGYGNVISPWSGPEPSMA
jgi:aspartyl-tRNA(Asn)/glutamyl-tRNA(Gln) amidotransferase subunit A